MDDRFYNGIIGCSTKVCGYKLKALTPWHYVLLTALDSPILTTTNSSDINDLLVFLKVVQTQWPEQPKLSPSLHDHVWFWRMKRIKRVEFEMGKLKEWLEVQLSSPKLWKEDQESGRKTSSPGIFMLVAGMISTGGLSLSEAWNMRLSEAQWLNVTLAELNGAKLKIAYENENLLDIPKPSEAEIMEQAKKALSPAHFQEFKKARLKGRKNGR